MAFASSQSALPSASFARIAILSFIFLVLASISALAQTPIEVQNLMFSDTVTLTWGTVVNADFYNIRGGRGGRPDPAR